MMAGTVSTVLFAAANLPMVVKAVRTGDLRSYSASALILGNVGNLVHTVYVVSLPFGPIWILHAFYLASMAIMLVLYAVPARRHSAAASAPRMAEAGIPPRSEPVAAVRFPHGGHASPGSSSRRSDSLGARC